MRMSAFVWACCESKGNGTKQKELSEDLPEIAGYACHKLFLALGGLAGVHARALPHHAHYAYNLVLSRSTHYVCAYSMLVVFSSLL